MTALLILLCVILLIIVVIQIGKVSEIATSIKGEKAAQRDVNYWHSRLGLVFVIVFLSATLLSAYYYKNYMMGFGPHESASAHGHRIDFAFHVTLVITGIVFIITHIALFYFSFKYRGRKGHKAKFIPHNNTLEVIWTIVPAMVLTILVVYGLDTWNEIMADIGSDEEVIEIEATGMQFSWLIRYPGPDGEFGNRYFRNISGANPLGQIWTDEANLDDFMASKIVLPVGKKVRVKITSRDVIHSFFLPQFRVKMDAVPGMPTYFVFTPTTTTEAYRQRLRKYDEYQVASDPDNPGGPRLWETFVYELACAELCGKGHFSMRREVEIVTPEEYQKWLKTQESYYESAIKGTQFDPLTHDKNSEASKEEKKNGMNADSLESVTPMNKADSVKLIES